MVKKMNDFEQSMAERVQRAEQILDRYLPAEEGYQKTIFEAVNYSVRAGGKRLRPILMREVYEMCGGTDSQVIEPFMARWCTMIFRRWIMMITAGAC